MRASEPDGRPYAPRNSAYCLQILSLGMSLIKLLWWLRDYDWSSENIPNKVLLRSWYSFDTCSFVHAVLFANVGFSERALSNVLVKELKNLIFINNLLNRKCVEEFSGLQVIVGIKPADALYFEIVCFVWGRPCRLLILD